MSHTAPVQPASTTRRRKIQAIIAGGVVLGIGAAATLATWNDSEFAQGVFGSGTFDLEGSTNGSEFSSHPTESKAVSLNFDAGNMIPDQTVHAPLQVRLTGDSTVDGSIARISVAQSSGANLEHLSYRVYQGSTTCDTSGRTGGTQVASGDLSDSSNGTNPDIALRVGEGDQAGSVVRLCFQVTSDSDLLQGEESSATWQVVATSDDD